MTRPVALFAALMLGAALCSQGARPAYADDQEKQIGDQVYADLAKKGEIISHSPLYDTLNPIAARIKAIADPQYQYPFKFILVHEKQPNAFAVPGGNVYVTDSLMQFVKTKEELAGVLCHETSHDIHHDVINVMKKQQGVQIGATLLELLIGRGQNGLANLAINLAANVQTMSFSRPVETAADLKGADTCAQAGYNAYGMIWLFERFEKAGTGKGSMEMLSDHPRDDHRIADLERHFAQNPHLFGGFPKDVRSGTPLPQALSHEYDQHPPGVPTPLPKERTATATGEYAPDAAPTP
jgi:predicted Zn-dependent protease